jgi:tRNA U34 5-methylaminomethyl-2-thiouridine-forming methyltransferase MnmC
MQPKDFSLYVTNDGTSTLYSVEMQESYHSLNGAAQESKHVFIEAGLRHTDKENLNILEIGFGTGLNALLTWSEAKKKGMDIYYTSIEAFPLPLETISKLNYEMEGQTLGKDAFSRLHEAHWDAAVQLEERCFTLFKLYGDFTTMDLPKELDLVYFDAFAPEKQPEMWEEHLFQKVFESMNDSGILVTYCAKGEVRRRLQRCGFQVERIPGPPGKREMLRAVKAS